MYLRYRFVFDDLDAISGPSSSTPLSKPSWRSVQSVHYRPELRERLRGSNQCPWIAYSSRFGGDALDEAHAIAVDGQGTAYVVGEAGSYNFPLLYPVQPKSHGGFDAAIVAVTPSGNAAKFSTYYRGQGDDYAYAVAAGAAGSVYVAGQLDTTHYTATKQPFRGRDGFVLAMNSGAMAPKSFPCEPRYKSGGKGCPKK